MSDNKQFGFHKKQTYRQFGTNSHGIKPNKAKNEESNLDHIKSPLDSSFESEKLETDNVPKLMKFVAHKSVRSYYWF